MTAAAQAPAFAVPGGLRDIARQGSESMAAAAKIVSDLTAQEVSMIVGMLRERVSLRPSATTAERAGRVVTVFTEAGKTLLDLAVSETAIVAEGVKDVFGLRPSIAALVDMVPRGIETMLDMHKRLLDGVATQTQELVDAYTADKPLMLRSRTINSVRAVVDGFILAQKTFLDQVSEQVTLATETPKSSKPRTDLSKTLIELSRQGVEKFIETQKILLDLAVENAEAETERPRGRTPSRTSMAELTRKSVHNFTTAQKSLLDLALSRIPPADETAPRRRSRKTEEPDVEVKVRRAARAVARETAKKAGAEAGRKAGRAAGRKAGRAAAKEEVAAEIEEI